ncbi:MAG: CbiX/SirB N-terminal domain-containing protein, partial [Undibacterium sp.]|nr:CbiX/SirB N-terminal domain-containing protein [Undibacterium sp.]
MSDSALILFAHGARDPAWAGPFQRLQKLTQASLPGVRVELAFLEFLSPNLPTMVQQLVDETHPNPVTKITVVPIFLGQG